jgi:hypothetical protein
MERKQLEGAAATNHYLRGLLAIPFGLLWIFSGLGNLEWGPFRYVWVVPVAILVAGAAFLLLMRYYNDHYGRVTPKGGPRTTALAALSVAVMVGGPILVQALDLPINGFGASWALVALGYYRINVGLRAHHIVIWGALLVASLVPLWGDPRTSDTLNIGMLMIGGAAILTGIFDHRLLVRSLGPAHQLDFEDTRAGG